MAKKQTFSVDIVDTRKALDALIRELNTSTACAIDLETTSLDTKEAEIVGISLCMNDTRAYYIPVGHTAGTNLPCDLVLDRLKKFCTNPQTIKIGHNLKYDMGVLARYDMTLAPVWDTLLAGYLLRRGMAERALDLGSLALHSLHYQVQPIEELIGKKGKEQKTFDTVPIAAAAQYSGEDAWVAWRLKKALEPQIAADGLTPVLETIELPLIRVLIAMEQRGIAINETLLRKLSKKLAIDSASFAEEIFALAGETLNLNSPKQLSQILFTKLGIPTKGIKRTQTSFSTASPELEKIDHPIAEKIIAFRELDKLKNTYVDTLPLMVHPHTHRVHTTFNQAIAATGRLSSTNPGLQNIPIRTSIGKQIRAAFVAEKGNALISADYSQIELRILAHLSNDALLIQAFAGGIDIHAQTASLIEHVPLDQVTSDMRRAAKVVNFGILYGLGPHRLARETDMTFDAAKDFIDKYFSAYPGIRTWIDDTKKFAYAHGYTETIFGRRRYFPELADPAAFMRSAGERMAVNMPTQGSAADIMKLAMIALYDALRARKMRTSILLQVHDELVLESPTSEVTEAAALVRECMSSVTKLAVPLTVEVAAGKNWADMEVM